MSRSKSSLVSFVDKAQGFSQMSNFSMKAEQAAMSGNREIEKSCQNMTCSFIRCFPGRQIGRGFELAAPGENMLVNLSVGNIGDSHQKRFALTGVETRPTILSPAFLTRPY